MELLKSLFSCFIPNIQLKFSSFNHSDATENSNSSLIGVESQKGLTHYKNVKKNDDLGQRLNPFLVEAVLKYRTYDMDSMLLDEVRLIAAEIFEIYKPNLKTDPISNSGELESLLVQEHLSTQSLYFRFAMAELFSAYMQDAEEKKLRTPNNAFKASYMGCTGSEFLSLKKSLSIA